MYSSYLLASSFLPRLTCEVTLPLANACSVIQVRVVSVFGPLLGDDIERTLQGRVAVGNFQVRIDESWRASLVSIHPACLVGPTDRRAAAALVRERWWRGFVALV